jgi:cation transport ATPase
VAVDRRAVGRIAEWPDTRAEGWRREQVPIEDVRVGDLVVIRQGERACRWTASVSGRSSVNEAMITGEPMR